MQKFKNKLFVILFTSIFFLSSITQVLAALDPMPAYRTPFALRDRYDTDLFTGSATYSYPIKIPKGTNDLTPEVALSYNSSGAHDPSAFAGNGWQLSQDYIQRDSNFTPADTSDDKFKLHFKGATYDLVYNPTDSLFHTKIESHLKIQQFLSGGTNTIGMYWQVTTPDGTLYRFGYGSNSENLCISKSYDYTWNLDQVQDTHNNHIYYTYTQSSGVAYPSQIRYNNDQTREIDFVYTANPYQKQIYVQGCSITETSRLSNIQVKVGTNLIHQYDLNFINSANGQNLLQSITEKGSDGSALPPTTFTYKPTIKNWSTQSTTWINNAPVDVHLMSTDVVQADVTGDGLLDIVKSEGTSSNTWKVFRNNGNGWNTTPELWENNTVMAANLSNPDVRLVDVTGDGLPDIVKSEAGNSAGKSYWHVWRNTGSSWSATQETWVNNSNIDAYFAQGTTALIDVNGDGLADIVHTWWNGLEQWDVYRNNGSGWNTTPEVWSYNGVGQNINDPSIKVMDVNGDGLPDIVKATPNGTSDTWQVWKNTGSGWSTTPETWLNNAPVDANFSMTNVTVQDVNGDGLPDIVKSLENPNRWLVLLNQGNSWSPTWEEWVNPAGPVLASLQGNTQMADVDGDGLPDIIRTSANGGNDTWDVFKNNGHAPDLLSTVHTAQGGVINFDYTPSTHYTNTGLPFNLWVVTNMTINNGLTNSQQTNDTTTYSYKNGFYKWQDHEFRGFGEVDTVEPNGAKKQYIFNQDDAAKGKIASILTSDANNNPYSKTEDTWSNTLANSIYTVNLNSEKNYTYDGVLANPKLTETDYQYDTYGNVTKKSELGDTSVIGDEKFTYNDYIYNPTLWIVNKLAHTTLKSSDDTTKVSEQWEYYDAPSIQAPNSATLGDGNNGDLTIASNTTEVPIDSVVSATTGSTTATVGSGLGFFTNQLVLFHQTQGSNAGAWEIARVQSYSGTNLTLTAALANSYNSTGSNHAQVRVIPQYHNVTINSGSTWTPKAWNGATGGILAFLANGTVNVNGTISADTRGFRGGVGMYAPSFSGEGVAGISAISFSNNGNGAGGANNTGGNGLAGAVTGGGTGGGGTVSTQSSVAAGNSDLTSLVLGGGGSGGENINGGSGGNGGAIVFISSNSINIAGSISANGSNGLGQSGGNGGGGGGGGGGSILIRTGMAGLGNSSVSLGGSGGTGAYGTGGVGGVGRIRVEYETSLTGNTNPAASSLQKALPTLPAAVSGGAYPLTKGDLTSEVNWLNGGTNPVTTSAYDAFGNQTSITDANNHTTSTAYDITGTYPISTTNAKNQTTTMNYDLGTGNLLSKTDPNNNITSYTYDPFGRILTEIKPDDSANAPTTTYQYSDNNAAPQGVLSSKRQQIGSASATLDSYTWIDGLGRTIQARTPAEDTTKQIESDTFYDPLGKIIKQSVPYLAPSSTIPQTLPAATAFGDGSYGDLIISANTTEAPIDSAVTATAGNKSATVGSGLGFAPNQIVLLHQTQGTNAGTWEFARVQSYSGTTLNLASALTNSYTGSGSNHAQVRVVPQYHNVTVNSGATWTPKAWDGATGGILAFLANGTVTINGTIRTGYDGSNPGSGFGFRNAIVAGGQGEGTTGDRNAVSDAANGNGGGGASGGTDGNRSGGGGGGNGATGNTGTGSGGTGGSGAAIAGTADLTSMVFGGGGGASTGNVNGSGGIGATGAGIVFITGATVNVTGTITSNGGNGQVGGTYVGPGGGGAGGSVLIRTQTANFGTNLITATGGAGGNGGGGFGGNGGDGRIRIEYATSLTGITTPAASTLQTQIPVLPNSSAISLFSNSIFTNPDPTAKYTASTYDPIGRETIVTNPKGLSKTTAYDHWKQTAIDENGHIKRYFLNAYNKINRVEEINSINSYATTYDYDTRDLLTKITDSAGNISTFAYDSLGHKTSQVDPDMGNWQYTYDGVGNLLTQKDNRNITTTKTYDELNRVTKVSYPTDPANTFAYDLGKIGTLSIATDSAGTVNYTYDNRLRKTSEQRTINGATKTTQFAYDDLDRVTSQTNPDGEVVTYTHNSQGEINSVAGTANILNNIDYNALGKITKKTFANGVTTNYTYNTDDFRLNRILTTNASPATTLQDLNYTYDNVGNILGINDALNIKTRTFSYDDLDRLTTASESGGFNYAYQYNSIGNLLKFTNAGIDTNYTYGTGSAIPHALTSASTVAVPTPTPTSAPTPTPTPAPTAVVFDSTSNSGEKTSVISSTHAHTVGAGLTNSILLVGTATRDTGNANYPITSVTYNGLSLTKVRIDTYNDTGIDGGQLRTELWYLVNPPSGTHNVVVNFTGTVTRTVIGAVSLSGVDQTNPIDSQAGSNNIGQISPLSTTINIVNANSWIFDTTYSKTGGAMAVGSNQTQRWNVPVNTNGDQVGGSTKIATNSGATTMQWTYAAADDYVQSVVAVKPATTPSSGISLRAATPGNNGAGGTTLTLNKPTGTTPGDVMVAHVVVRTAGNTITPPSGWSLILRKDTGSSISTATYWKLAGASEPTSYSWTFGTSGEASGGIASYIGVNPTSPIDANNAQYNSGISSANNAGVTTFNANDRVVYAVGVTVPTTVNVPTGFTQEWTGTSSTSTTSEMSDKLFATAGATGTITASHNGGANSNITIAIALKPAGTSTDILLSQGKPIVASTQKVGYEATNANDGVLVNSYWEAANNTYPSTLTVDLGAIHAVDKVVMKLDWGTRIENVEILGSTDNITFTTIVPAANYSIGTVPVTFTSTNTRYVRLKVNSNNSAASAQMAEFEAWGN